jgi:hypothetical protein
MFSFRRKGVIDPSAPIRHPHLCGGGFFALLAVLAMRRDAAPGMACTFLLNSGTDVLVSDWAIIGSAKFLPRRPRILGNSEAWGTPWVTWS